MWGWSAKKENKWIKPKEEKPSIISDTVANSTNTSEITVRISDNILRHITSYNGKTIREWDEVKIETFYVIDADNKVRALDFEAEDDENYCLRDNNCMSDGELKIYKKTECYASYDDAVNAALAALNEKYKKLYNEVFKESLKVREGDGIYIFNSKDENYKPEPDNMSEEEYKKYKRGKK